MLFDEKYISRSLPLDNDQPYWTQQLLVVDQWPLQKCWMSYFVIKRYLPSRCRIEKYKNFGRILSKNPEQSLETLAYSHQLEMNYYSQYLLNIKKIKM